MNFVKLPLSSCSRLAVLVFALAASLLVGACGGRNDSDADVIVIKATDQLRFEPAILQVKVGELIQIRLDNSKGKALHDLTIDEMPASAVGLKRSSEHEGHGSPINIGPTSTAPIHIAAEAGKIALVEFVPDKAGRYVFYCGVSGHRQGGMEGVIVVDPV